MNRRKTPAFALLCVLCALSIACFALEGFAFSNPFAEPASTAWLQKECVISVSEGAVLEFSADDLEQRMALSAGSLRGLTVTELPSESQGVLLLDGAPVERYQRLSRAELDRLCFVPGERAVAASFTLLPQSADSRPTQLSINVLSSVNLPPTVESGEFATLRNTRLCAIVSARDPDGDALQIQVTSSPSKGQVSFDGLQFTYTPFQDKTGSDCFTIRAVDRFGNYSSEASIGIRIERNRSGFRYMDLSGNPSEYAAFKLYEAGVLRGEQIGGRWFFLPEQQLSRSGFLIQLLAASGLDGDLSPTVNTGLPNDSELPLWLKPYLKRAIDEKIWDKDTAFSPDEIPTRAEAVSLTDRAAKITDVKEYTPVIEDLAAIPSWALPAYRDLAAYRMLDLHDGYAHPSRALDRAYSADLLWQLYKHTHR